MGVTSKNYSASNLRTRAQVGALTPSRNSGHDCWCHFEGSYPMAWKTPQIIEIAVGMEINSYACADL
jgi:coenzyme PQQ precursor peptide PqqA